MPEDLNTMADASDRPAGYCYPRDLALFVRDRWKRVPEFAGVTESCPNCATLEAFFSACYHASLVREEDRPVTFRAILAAPTLFTRGQRPPDGLQLLEFSRSLPFHPEELRRLSVAVDPERTLICVQSQENGKDKLQIWGLINSGTRWLRDVQGGRSAGPDLPSAPVVRIDAPGSIEVFEGNELIGRLHGGKLSGSRVDLFKSEWLPIEFSEFRKKLMDRHKIARTGASELSGERWASLEPTLPRRIAERMMKRVIAMLREARHGGTILFVPATSVQNLSSTEPHIDLKYRFADGCNECSFADLVVEILNRLGEVYGSSHKNWPVPVGWQQFEEAADEELAILDESLFETAHLVAGLAAVDGAVVMSKQHELLGFGGMISGRLPAVRTVARAMDVEGLAVVEEGTGNVSARHRSAYRLANAVPGSVAIVISQDGGVRFVSQKDGRVTYWEQE